MSPEAIGAILVGLTGLVTAIGTITAQRSRRIEADVAAQGAELAALRQQLVLAERYIARLKRALARHDLDLPDPPEGFGDDHEAALATAPATGRRHRRRA